MNRESIILEESKSRNKQKGTMFSKEMVGDYLDQDIEHSKLRSNLNMKKLNLAKHRLLQASRHPKFPRKRERQSSMLSASENKRLSSSLGSVLSPKVIISYNPYASSDSPKAGPSAEKTVLTEPEEESVEDWGRFKEENPSLIAKLTSLLYRQPKVAFI